MLIRFIYLSLKQHQKTCFTSSGYWNFIFKLCLGFFDDHVYLFNKVASLSLYNFAHLYEPRRVFEELINKKKGVKRQINYVLKIIETFQRPRTLDTFTTGTVYVKAEALHLIHSAKTRSN